VGYDNFEFGRNSQIYNFYEQILPLDELLLLGVEASFLSIVTRDPTP
jgi:hypothetical protein